MTVVPGSVVCMQQQKIRFFSGDSPTSVQPTAALAIKQDTETGTQPTDIRRSVGAGLPSPYKRTTETPVIDSGSDVLAIHR